MRIVALVTAVLVLAACAGRPINWSQARQLHVGMSEAEVTQLMGAPGTVTSRDGQQIWVWVFVNGITFASESLSVVFEDGKAVSVPDIPKSFR